MNKQTIPPLVGRILLGLIYFVFGLNGFLDFIKMPPPPPAAGAFFGAMMATGYLLPFVKATEVIGGALLLSGKLVPFALTILAAITLNIVAFHTFLTPPNPMAYIMLMIHLFLAWSYRSNFKSVLEVNAKPTGA